MKYLHQSNKGFALVEMMVVLGLIGLILLPLFAFLMNNINMYNRADDEIELQYQGQMAMNTLIDKIIETKGIYRVYGKNRTNITNSIKNNSIGKVIFKKDGKNLCFEHKFSELFYGNNSWANVVYADFIEDFQIEPIGGPYENCKGIKIKIKCKKNKSLLTVTNQIYFRNQ